MIQAQRTGIQGKTDARRKFGRFKAEKPKAVRTADVRKHNPKIDMLLEEFRKLELVLGKDMSESQQDFSRLDYSPSDVMELSILASSMSEEDIPGTGFYPQRAAVFLNSLINSGKDGDYIISVNPEKFYGLLTLNCKNVRVIGNVCTPFAHKMKSGTVVLEGDVGVSVGTEMSGGEIHIEGEIGNLEESIRRCNETIVHGKIFHKGKLIVDK